MKKNRAEKYLVLGVNGQDGSYLAEHLLLNGSEVIGIGRQNLPKWISPQKRFKYCRLDLNNIKQLVSFLNQHKPDVIYNASATHGPSGFCYEESWHDAHLVHVLATNACLEYIRKNDGKYIFISSSKVFGNPPPEIISESTTLKSSCIYSITKNMATDLIHYYRNYYDVKASVIWTLNHDSSRKDKTYFLPKIVDILSKAKANKNYKSSIYSLDFYCDWGHAKEYMEFIVNISSECIGEDFILATGKQIFARDFVEDIFLSHELNAYDHLVIESLDQKQHRENRTITDLSKLKKYLKKLPQMSPFDIVEDILSHNY